ncbi:unnamed protein product, partial [Mesorhabditis belari]|uniref:Alpha-carbonic anhydrase domain-containing protein n=1 Tax=Mesorhabditis belari TaxID=2138241 RepID=A0AAF3J1Y8_9BILA
MLGPLIFLVAERLSLVDARSDWTYPWKYDSMFFEGQDYWGVHSEWAMCSRGKLQSPIDINPSLLLHDPSLKPINIDRISVHSEMVNTGQMPRVRIGNSARRPTANLTGGPLNTYRYRIQRIDIHFGVTGQSNGSEHAIDGRKFPMELQLLAFNADLYANFSQASRSTHGIAAIAVLVEFGPETNAELLRLTVAALSVQFKNQRVDLVDLSPWKLLPRTRDYVTYEGSITAPPCDETVQWIVLNQPIHITHNDYAEWSRLSQNSPKEDAMPIAPNFRSLVAPNHRTVRTNIAHISEEDKFTCDTSRITYKVFTTHNQKLT